MQKFDFENDWKFRLRKARPWEKIEKRIFDFEFFEAGQIEISWTAEMYICQFDICWFWTCLLLYENYIFLEQCKQLIWNLMKTTF